MTDKSPNFEAAFRTLCKHVRREVKRNERIPYEAAAYRAEEARNIYAFAEGIAKEAGIVLPKGT